MLKKVEKLVKGITGQVSNVGKVRVKVLNGHRKGELKFFVIRTVGFVVCQCFIEGYFIFMMTQGKNVGWIPRIKQFWKYIWGQ
jgi:hypothetical protein